MADLLSRLGALDAAAFLLVNGWHHPLLDLLMPLLSQKQYALIPAAALAIVLVRTGGRRAWLLVAAAVAAVALSDLSASALKALFDRARPCHVILQARLLTGCTTSFAFPSNHASNMAALAAAAWAGSRLLGAALLALALAVAYSRVYLGVHYPGDVLAGVLLGAGIGWVTAWSALRVLPRLQSLCRGRSAASSGTEGSDLPDDSLKR